LTKEARILLAFLIVLSLIFGSFFYIITLIAIIYFLLYGISIQRGSALLKTDVNAHTIRQHDYITFFYHLTFNFLLPVVCYIELESPYYFVAAEGERERTVFARLSDIKGTVRYVGNRRGVYEIGKFVLHISDPLGFFKRKINVSNEKKIYVFPFIVSFQKLNVYLSEPLSGIKAKYQINSDYTSIAGVRDYVQGDPLSMIHWKQTAHRNKLTVKELDFTASKRIYIILNLYRKNLQFQDSATAIAASIANYAIHHHLPVGLIVNGNSEMDLPQNDSGYHLMKLFKMLAFASDKDAKSTVEFLKILPSKLPFGVELFYIDKDISEEVMLSLMRIKPFVSRLNIVLLPDNTFVLPHEKPPRYYFKEAYYLTVLGHSKEALAKEGIYVYPILGKDYANKLEKV